MGGGARGAEDDEAVESVTSAGGDEDPGAPVSGGAGAGFAGDDGVGSVEGVMVVPANTSTGERNTTQTTAVLGLGYGVGVAYLRGFANCHAKSVL